MYNKDAKNIYTSYITEARRTKDQKVDAVNDFIAQIDDAKGAEVSYDLLMDLLEVIYKSGCPKIKFDGLTGALGISKADECILSTYILELSLPKMLYIILHEVAHQFQYTKHGEEFAQDIFFGDKSDLESAKDLLRIENIADRFAVRMTKHLLTKYKIPFKNYEVAPLYKSQTPLGISHHVSRMRNTIKMLDVKDIHILNDLLYNSLKQTVLPAEYREYNLNNNNITNSESEQDEWQRELDFEQGQL